MCLCVCREDYRRSQANDETLKTEAEAYLTVTFIYIH